MSKNPIVHVEIPATDPKAAGKFYGDLFGWKITSDDQYDYTMFGPEDGPGGGFTTVDGEQTNPGDVLVYVGVPDIEATLAEIERLGGKTIRPKTEIPGVGSFAIFADPTGNKLALWTVPDES